VLIIWNQPDRRSDRDIVEDLEPILVLDSGCDSGELLEVIFQRLTPYNQGKRPIFPSGMTSDTSPIM
jgi:hypothetical protein